MDKFVVKVPSAFSKLKTQSHLPVNITVNDRARNYPEGTFHVDNGGLFCSSCNGVVDHRRKFVVDKCLEAASHKRNTERKDGGKQQTLKTEINCKTVAQVEKVRICHEWIKVCTTANIPLHKLDTSFFTLLFFIYNRSTNMNYFIYISHDCTALEDMNSIN